MEKELAGVGTKDYGPINSESGPIMMKSGLINPESGPIMMKSGLIVPESGLIIQGS